MKAIALGAAMAALGFGIAVAQTTPSTTGSATRPGTPPAMAPTPMTPAPMTAAPMTAPGTATTGTATTGTTAGTAAPMGAGGTAAASGNNNQAVATTNANAPQPAKGSNSFTAGQARRRIARQGYQKVAGLKKDNDGVWRGTAVKSGQNVNVWLDYKGNVGTSAQ